MGEEVEWCNRCNRVLSSATFSVILVSEVTIGDGQGERIAIKDEL